MPPRLKARLCGALSATGLDGWMGAVSGAAKRPWVTGYHAVVEDEAAMGELMPGLAITASTFEQHVDWMAKRFELIALDQLPDDLGALERAPRPKKPLAAITFDDGYRGVFDFALPILRRKGVPATLFVVTDRVGAPAPLAHDRIFRLLRKHRSIEAAHQATRTLLHTLKPEEIERLADQLGETVGATSPEMPVSWPMVLALQAAGWTIGSHTRTHARLVTCSEAELREETAGSRRTLQAKLGAPVRHFAYPDGAFAAAAVDAIADAGFSFAYTTCSHRDPRYPELTYPRTMLWERSSVDGKGKVSPAILSVQASGLIELFAGCRIDHERSIHPL